MPQHQRKKNHWKRLFFWLFGANILIVAVLIAFIFWPVPSSETPEATNNDTQRSSDFTVRTSKENLNELINAYIDKLLEGNSHQYSVSLDDDVQLNGELPVFSSTVPVTIHLEPLVQDNGDVILRQESISLGQLELPNKKIMSYLQEYLPMPEWVTVSPADEEIYLAVTDMEVRSNFQISVENFNLETNNLAFKIDIPYESLGIPMEDY